jgi:hypothetical protein
MPTAVRIAERDRKLLASERSYRRGRAGALFLAAITAAVWVLVVATKPSEEAFLASGPAQCCFWLALAWGAHARLQHIESLKVRPQSPPSARPTGGQA